MGVKMIDDALGDVLDLLDKFNDEYDEYAINEEYIDKNQLAHLVVLQQLALHLENINDSLQEINETLIKLPYKI